ncbi:MAG TPA: hypothetical protein VMW48_09805, partial [Vicinamibacterales bacterium]|nr:hypothetical protein [Vicinamibacterales bacterium]
MLAHHPLATPGERAQQFKSWRRQRRGFPVHEQLALLVTQLKRIKPQFVRDEGPDGSRRGIGRIGL